MVQVTRERVRSIGEVASQDELIRSAIIAELDAVSLYQSQIENITDFKVKDVLSHIRDEEKEHIAELSCLLIQYDVTQREALEEIIKKQFPDINLTLESCIIGQVKKEAKEEELIFEGTLEEQSLIPLKERTRRARRLIEKY